MFIFKYEKEIIACHFPENALYSFFYLSKLLLFVNFYFCGKTGHFNERKTFYLEFEICYAKAKLSVPKEYYPRHLKSEKWTCKCSKSAHLRHF